MPTKWALLFWGDDILNRCFDKIRGGRSILYIHKDFRNDTFEQVLLDGGERLGELYQLTTVQSSNFARVYKLTVRFNNFEKRIYFKQYLCRSVWDFIKDFVRAGRAERAFRAAEMLSEEGFEAPTIIAMGKSRDSLYHAINFLVTLEVEGAEQICQLVPHLREDSKLTTKDKRDLIGAFGQTIGKMHAKGIFHGDLRLGNVLARKEENCWRFFFLDNERTRKFNCLPKKLKLKNLVQVNMYQPATISNTDRMRFFRRYRAENNGSKVEETMLIKKVLKKTSRRLRKKMKARR